MLDKQVSLPVPENRKCIPRDLPQFVHSLETVGDLIHIYGGPHFLEDDRLPRIVNDNNLRDSLLGHQLEGAVGQLDPSIIDDGLIIRANGFESGKGECRHRQTDDPSASRSANPCDWRVDRKTALRRLAGHESNGAFRQNEQG